MKTKADKNKSDLRENAELRLDRDAWVEQHHNRTKLIDELQAKLAAAEATLTKLQKLAEERSKYRLMVPPSQIIAAIDAAKTEVPQRHAVAEYPPDGLEISRRLTEESLARDAAKTEAKP